jgi:hypothetical protein
MSETSVPPELTVSRPVDIGLHLLGIVACAAAAYHAGKTGSATPLLLASMGTGLVVLFITSE